MLLLWIIRLWATVTIGLIICLVIGIMTESPAIAVASYLLWAVLNHKGITKEDEANAHD